MSRGGKIACDYIFPNGSRQQAYRKFDMPLATVGDTALPGLIGRFLLVLFGIVD
jgi:hypothetical protein